MDNGDGLSDPPDKNTFEPDKTIDSVMTMTKIREYKWVLYGTVSILVILGVSLIYSIVADISTQLHTPVTLATPVDLAIPLIPPAIIIYWYVFYSFIFFSYFYFAFVHREYRNALVLAYVLVNLVAYAIYLVFPVLGPERAVSGSDFFSYQIQLLYAGDVPVNCFPSLHGSTSLLSAYALWRAKKEYGYISWPIAVAVMVSTLLVRQHWIVDQIAATLVTLPIAYFVFTRFKYTKVLESKTVVKRWQLLVSTIAAVFFMVLYILVFYVM
ncbi:MAG: phosphatase PAP2 family protein [Candidatus Thorarchaeota archaeon]|nr:phosphatase PAP2 family protein [Candidatus Thorarchaeota archaeon]